MFFIGGSGAGDKNGTVGFVHKNGPKPLKPYSQIAQYLSERGFAILRYDKRGIGANSTINQNLWGNTTINDLIEDSKKALNVLIQQPEVDSKRVNIIGHSEGTVDNSTKVTRQLLTKYIHGTGVYWSVTSVLVEAMEGIGEGT